VILKARAQIEHHEIMRANRVPVPLVNPYLAAAPDALLVSSSPDFNEGPSWTLDPALGGIMRDDRG